VRGASTTTSTSHAARDIEDGPPPCPEPTTSGVDAAPDTACNQIQLLGHFELRTSRMPAPLPTNAQRLLAILAIRGGAQHRTTIAGLLWVETSDQRAGANLRTAIWGARRVDQDLIETTGAYLRLGRHVRVDVVEVVDTARRLLEAPSADDLSLSALQALAEDLLPEWYDDWVLFERERLRQIRLHGLEALCIHLTAQRRYAAAIEAGLLGIEVEPLRESTHLALIRAHLAEGNMSEAVRQFDALAATLRDHLGIEPSDAARALVLPCR
jgi:DNA-binding SARP family transcriptional activator